MRQLWWKFCKHSESQVDDARKKLWAWVEFRNGGPNTDIVGFVALSEDAIFQLLEESKKDTKWLEFENKYKP